MIRFALILVVYFFWCIGSLSAAEVTAGESTPAEMKAMIVELYEIEKKIGPEE